MACPRWTESRGYKAGAGFSSWKELYVELSPNLIDSEPNYFKISGIVGVLTILFLVDFPDKAHRSFKFLSEKECAFIIRRINRDRADGDAEAFSMKNFLMPALDLKIWGFAMIFL